MTEIIFHTFDEGKGKNWEGRCVPIIGFERWFPPDHRIAEIADVCNLDRARLKHPSRTSQHKLPQDNLSFPLYGRLRDALCCFGGGLVRGLGGVFSMRLMT